MSKRTRVGTKIDAQRLAALASRPGIDPRMWISLCVVDKVVTEAAGQGQGGSGGVFVDVFVMTTATTDDDGNVVAQKETVRLAPAYAGNGFGLYFPPRQGDEVLVAWADGDPDHGGLLIGRAWSASDPPPQLAVNNPDDALLIVEKDCNLRIVTQGQGNAVIAVDKGKVLLGSETGTSPVARKGDPVDGGTLYFQGGSGGATLAWTPPGYVGVVPPGTPITLQSGKISDGSGNVESS